MLVERIFLHILPTVTTALAVQKGILANGNNYLMQIQNTVGESSNWTYLYMEAAGISNDDMPPTSVEKRGIAALRLYQETVHLLKLHIPSEDLNTIEPLLGMIDHVLDENIA